MSYQVIARKFRPQTFEQLVGQSHVTTTLLNALKQDRLHPALLFTGPRGTGKTSSARILAKSLRCPNAVACVPCGTCPDCLDIAVGRSVDVIEIDGASNNGVDAVRELRETIGFMPSSGRFKVYIIDEVHMLSTAAFNALLKTLEEPPSHVIFILATTEVHKLPATILSRLQRYDFRRISTRVITDQLQMICEQENLQAEPESLWMVARQADGSMRDAQSLLEQVMTFAQGHLSVAQVGSILGLTDQSILQSTLLALSHRRPADLQIVFKQISEVAIDPFLFIQSLLQDFRHITMARLYGEKANELIDRSDAEIRLFQEVALNLSEVDLQILFDMALKGASDIQHASEPLWVLEMVLLRMATAPRWADFAKLQTVLQSEGSGAESAIPTSPAPRKPKPAAQMAQIADLSPQERWYEFVLKVKRTEPLLAAKLEPLQIIEINEKDCRLQFAIPPKVAFLRDQLNDKTVIQKIETLLTQQWGKPWHVSVSHATEPGKPVLGSAQKVEQEKAKQQESELIERVSKDPRVASFNKIFNGRIEGITPMKESENAKDKEL